MNDVQQRKAAKAFAARWKDKGYEKGESQTFWLTLLTDVFGVENVADLIEFEDQVHLDHTSFIDGYIPSTRTTTAPSWRLTVSPSGTSQSPIAWRN